MVDDKDNTFLEEKDEKGEKEEEIEIITGDGSDLDISPVYDHIKLDKPNKEKNQKIIIPKEKK